MGTRMRDAMMGRLGELRYEPTEKRIRVYLGDHLLVDTTGAYLVWEPRRIVPSYAVPVSELHGELSGAGEAVLDTDRLLHPKIPFAVHSTPGQSFTVRSRDNERRDAAFRPADADLGEHLV